MPTIQALRRMKAFAKLPNSTAPTIAHTEELSAATLRKVTWRLIPFLFLLYIIAWLDRVMDLLHAGGISVDLATATASPPPWLSHKHPEMLPVLADGVSRPICCS